MPPDGGRTREVGAVTKMDPDRTQVTNPQIGSGNFFCKGARPPPHPLAPRPPLSVFPTFRSVCFSFSTFSHTLEQRSESRDTTTCRRPPGAVGPSPPHHPPTTLQPPKTPFCTMTNICFVSVATAVTGGLLLERPGPGDGGEVGRRRWGSFKKFAARARGSICGVHTR